MNCFGVIEMFKDFYLNIKVYENGFEPKKALDGDAAYDVFSPKDDVIYSECDRKIDLDISVEFPSGYGMLFLNKSGRSLNDKLLIGGGLVDSNYRGIVSVQLFNNGKKRVEIKRGEKIAQFIIVPVWCGKINIVDNFINEKTNRGTGGHGSTGLM